MSEPRRAKADNGAPGEEPVKHRIECHLDRVLAQRGMTLTELSRRTGITMANLSILKTNKAKAIRFSTLTAICDALDTTPAELITIKPL
ncbi:helix-turn-helix transcriptional regulator [Arthrobacter sp. ATA002]|uniref:helix-turn-helix domain-containing protein n=1 Tax=Arthrobacter sp. ATA002 TaxID=2991715 RepID=UPI0022A7B743|nr:helix-turn-helix transcriptional regulator [Arthrobacter sp. ATA002]WAP53229.1 helix-turn-helix transcriptional regulator [Arthrobacter sp. ATA002]